MKLIVLPRFFRVFFALQICATALLADDTTPVALVEKICKSSKGPTSEEDADATRTCKLALLDKYINSLGQERQFLVSSKRSVLSADLDGTIQNYTERNRSFDKKTKVLTLSAQCNINKGKIDQLIDQTQQQGAHTQERNKILFVFTARRQNKVVTNPLTVTTGSKITKNSGQESASGSTQGRSSLSNTVTTAEAVSTTNTLTRKADEIEYAIENNAKASIDYAMSEVLINRGFAITPSETLVKKTKGKCNPDNLLRDFETSSEFSEQSKSSLIEGCRETNAKLLAYGTLTIGAQRRDPVNNQNIIVNVIVNAQILDCRDEDPVKVGGIGALQVECIGADQTQAETAAIKLAATKAAQVLADQLRSQGIR
jgi:hypothetical protein